MFDPAQLVFIDESWTNTSMVRLRGRCRRGERLIGYAPLGHWKTITFVAGLRVRARQRSLRNTAIRFLFWSARNFPVIISASH